MRTPWGNSDHITKFPNGIKFVSTPSHGGFWVPAKLLDHIPANRRAYAAEWSGSEQWYEEDCAWAAVVAAFPEVAQNPAEIEHASSIIARYMS